MNEIDRAVLQRLHQEIAKDVQVDDALLGDLFQNGVFGHPMIEDIKAKNTPTSKISTLLHLLPKRGPDALTKFIKSLQKDYHWLATKLTKTRHYMELNHRKSRRGNQQIRQLNNAHDQTAIVDKDIKKIVSRFVRKNFRHEDLQDRNKGRIEHFLSAQLQLERNRYQEVLSSPCQSLDHHRGSISSEISEKSNSVDLKSELSVAPERPDYSTDSDPMGGNEDGNQHCSIDIVMEERRSIRGRINNDTQGGDRDEYRKHISHFLTEVIGQCTALKEESLVFQKESKALRTESQALKEKVQDLKEDSMQIRHNLTAMPDEVERTIRGRSNCSTEGAVGEDYRKHIAAFLTEVIDQCNALKEESRVFQCETKALRKESDALKENVQDLRITSFTNRHLFTGFSNKEE